MEDLARVLLVASFFVACAAICGFWHRRLGIAQKERQFDQVLVDQVEREAKRRRIRAFVSDHTGIPVNQVSDRTKLGERGSYILHMTGLAFSEQTTFRCLTPSQLTVGELFELLAL